MRWRTPAVILASARSSSARASARARASAFSCARVDRLGWGREAFSFAIALQNLVWGCAMPFMGAIADRYGAGRVLTAGRLATARGCLRWRTRPRRSHSTSPPACSSASASPARVRRGDGRRGARSRRRSAASRSASWALAARSASSPCCPGQALISAYGWLTALVVLGLLSFLIVPLGAALAGRNAAEHESGQSIGAALAEATQHRGFWLLTGSFFVCGFQTIFVMTHLPAYLVDRGMSANEGMFALAVIGLFNIAGSAAAALGGRYSKRLLLAWIYVIRALAIAALHRRAAHCGRHLPLRRGARSHLARHRAAHQLARRPDLRREVSVDAVLDRVPRPPARRFHRRMGGRGRIRSYELVHPCGRASIALSVLAAALCVPINERALRPA